MAVIRRHPNVRAVAWGHAHQSLDVFRGGIRFLCTPSTCMQFNPRDPGFVRDDRPPDYRVFDLHDDGGIATEVAWLECYRQGLAGFGLPADENWVVKVGAQTQHPRKRRGR